MVRRLGTEHGTSGMFANLELINRIQSGRKPTMSVTRTNPKLQPLVALLAPIVYLQLVVGTSALVWTSLKLPGVPGWLLLVVSLVFIVSGTVVLAAGRWDPRTAPLAGAFFAIGSAPAVSLISPLTRSDDGGAFVLLVSALSIEAFFPFFLWWFVEQFPRVVRFERGGRLVTWFRLLSLWIGVGLAIINGIHILAPSLFSFDRIVPFLLEGNTSAYWLLIFLLSLPAPFFIFGRLRHADRQERRRALLFVFGLAAGVLPVILAVLAEIVSPTWATIMEVPTNRMIGSFVVYGFMLTIPVTLGYSVTARRVLELKLVLSRAAQVVLARGVLWSVSAIPWLMLGTVLWSERGHPLSDIAASPAVIVLTSLGVLGLILVLNRSHLLAGLERLLYGRDESLSAAVAGLTRRLSDARDVSEVTEIVHQHGGDAIRSESAFLLLREQSEGGFTCSEPRCRRLHADSALTALIAVSPDPISIDPNDRISWLPLLPEEDRLWVSDTEVHLIVPISTPVDGAAALLAFGPAASGRPYGAMQRDTAVTLASAISMALARTGSERAHVEPARHTELPAGECRDCGLIAETSDGKCRCGVELWPASIPFCLGGKFRLKRVLGHGGMGVVYLGEDMELGRKVALKTLPRMRSTPLYRLRSEARSMASFIHPNLAMIFGSETWRGVPVLVVEYLEGGTLLQRLSPRNAPVFAAEMGMKLARGVAALHSAGILHRDIKPSNIGFSAENEPKLLDFGIARIIEESGSAPGRPTDLVMDDDLWAGAAGITETDEIVGTPLYLSPEVLAGEPPSPAQDLWAFHLVLWETLAGRHPLSEMSRPQAIGTARAGMIPSIAAERPSCPTALTRFIDRGLSPDPGLRRSSARELRDDLTELVAQLDE